MTIPIISQQSGLTQSGGVSGHSNPDNDLLAGAVPAPSTVMPPAPTVQVQTVQPIKSKMPSNGVISHTPKGR